MEGDKQMFKMGKLMAAIGLILAVGTMIAAGPVCAGKIVVANDEWTLSNSGGFTAPNDGATFATNVASWFTGGPTGSFLAYSNNFGLTGTNLRDAMVAAGNTWTVTTSGALDLARMQSYDGVFLGSYTNATVIPSVLTDYINGGGNIYLCGGSATINEPTVWNPFLNNFGLNFISPYNGVAGNMAISSSHPIFAGVDHLYQNNGSTIIEAVPGNPGAQILVSYNGKGLYAVYEGSAPVVPEASSLLLALGIGLPGVAAGLRRRLR